MKIAKAVKILLYLALLANLNGQNQNFLKNWYWGPNGDHYILDLELIHSVTDPDQDLFHTPYKGNIVALDANNLLTFIVDPAWSRIVYAHYNDDWVKAYGSYGAGITNFKHPRDISADGLGNIYVADSHGGRIQVLYYDANNSQIFNTMQGDIGSGLLGRPWALDVDDKGNTDPADDHIWVIDKALEQILKFTINDQHLLSITSLYNPTTGVTYSDLSGLAGIAIRKSPANGNNSTANARLYLVDWKLAKVFLIGADEQKGSDTGAAGHHRAGSGSGWKDKQDSGPPWSSTATQSPWAIYMPLRRRS